MAVIAGRPDGPPPSYAPAPSYPAPSPYKPAPYKEEKLPPQPYTYEYGVKDEYSGIVTVYLKKCSTKVTL